MLVLAGALAVASVAHAQLPDPPPRPSERDVLEAREAFVRGTRLGAEERFEDARREFVHSYALSGSPVALFNLASTLRSLNLHREAAEAFLRLLARPDLDAGIRSRAAPMYVDVIARVTRLRLYGELDRATLRVDGGTPRPLSGQTQTVVVDPGPHELIADRQGSSSWSWSGTTVAGDSIDLLVDLEVLRSAPTPDDDGGDDMALIAAIASVSAAVVLLGVVVAVVLDGEAQLSPRTGLVIELP